MSTTDARCGLASEIDMLDAQMAELNEAKKEAFASYREAYGKAECKAAQAAIKRRQKYAAGKGDELEEHDALTDEVFADISTRAARVREEAA